MQKKKKEFAIKMYESNYNTSKYKYQKVSSPFTFTIHYQSFLFEYTNSESLFGITFSITQFPSFITHHSIFHTHLASSPNFHHSIFFTLFVGPYLSTGTVFFFF